MDHPIVSDTLHKNRSIESGGEYGFLPLKMFFGEKLVEMRLKGDFGVHWCPAEGEVTFSPVLKNLFINLPRVFCDKIDKFLLAFPVLEELQMSHVEWTDFHETVSSASLRKLTICGIGGVDFINPKRISFDIPSLVYLVYYDLVAEDYPKVNLINVVEAQINLSLTEDQTNQARAASNDEEDVFLRFGNAWKLLTGIKNVEKLILTHYILEVLSLCSASIPVFNNLKVLQIISDKERGWEAMPVLLSNCPNLETLVLGGLLHYETDKCGDACVCISQEEKGRSLASCPVKRLVILRFQGTRKEMRLIKHFLDYFPCLKEMDVVAKENSPLLKLLNMVYTLGAFKIFNMVYTCHVKFHHKLDLQGKNT